MPGKPKPSARRSSGSRGPKGSAAEAAGSTLRRMPKPKRKRSKRKAEAVVGQVVDQVVDEPAAQDCRVHWFWRFSAWVAGL